MVDAELVVVDFRVPLVASTRIEDEVVETRSEPALSVVPTASISSAATRTRAFATGAPAAS